MAFEISEHPTPAIFYTAYASIMSVHLPIIVYSICIDENIKASDIKDLQRYGFGLFTINTEGHVSKVLDGIPLIQYIPENEFADECKLLPQKVKRRLRESYETYLAKPQSGLSEITETTEEIINNALVQMIKKGWLANNVQKKSLSDKLTLMLNCTPHCDNAKPSIAGLITYISQYRNLAHHSAKNPKQLYDKIHSCQHGFREGIKRLKHFQDQMKHIGILLKVN